MPYCAHGCAPLPDLDTLDLEAMKALVIAQHVRYTTTPTSRGSEIERLVLPVEKLQRMLFDTKSEKVLRQIEQLQFQLEDLQVASAIDELQCISPAERPAPAKPFRRPLPKHLPREVHTHMPDHDGCPDCGGRLRELGEDVAEMGGEHVGHAGEAMDGPRQNAGGDGEMRVDDVGSNTGLLLRIASACNRKFRTGSTRASATGVRTSLRPTGTSS